MEFNMHPLKHSANHRSSASSRESKWVVDRVPQLNSTEFAGQYFKARRPVVITDMATQWPACSRWSFDFFSQLDPERSVTLEKGNVLQGKTDFESARLADYLTGLNGDEKKQPSHENADTKKRYLSMLKIFEQFPKLKDDVDFSLLEDRTLWQVYFAWLGPAGTLTGYHVDWIDNILAQIKGRKQVWLVPPSESSSMYPSKKYDYRSTLSEVEPNTWDAKRHPLFAEITPIEITLEAGEMLFIPRGWWHRVLSLTPSISINAFGHDVSGMLWYQSRVSLLRIFHKLGLYGNQSCTCHKKISDDKLSK